MDFQLHLRTRPLEGPWKLESNRAPWIVVYVDVNMQKHRYEGNN
jgi:hypothetical protein